MVVMVLRPIGHLYNPVSPRVSLVRHVCEYGSVALSPCTQKDIICVESVQCRAMRFVCNDYCRSSSINIMLSNLGWQDLVGRSPI